ncbi:MAG: alpha/beta fold hydrolase [Pseudomonadota bacterium]
MVNLIRARLLGAIAVGLTAGVATALIVGLSPGRQNAFAACPAVVAEFEAAAERVVEIDTPGGRIAATLAVPARVAPRALALMFHGYTGSRNEIPVAGGEGMFARAARAFAERGIAVLRIDFIGSGKSDGAWADTRFSGQARDAILAAQWLKAEHAGQDLPLGVLGYSQGGLVALRAAARAAPFDRLALWNPVMDPMTTYGVIFGADAIRAAAALAGGDKADAVFAETGLKPGFFAELVEADPIADAAESAAPILVVTGRRDSLVPDGAALAGRIAEARAADTLIVDLDAHHDLGARKEPALLDRVIACSAGFLLGTAER